MIFSSCRGLSFDGRSILNKPRWILHSVDVSLVPIVNVPHPFGEEVFRASKRVASENTCLPATLVRSDVKYRDIQHTYPPSEYFNVRKGSKSMYGIWLRKVQRSHGLRIHSFHSSQPLRCSRSHDVTSAYRPIYAITCRCCFICCFSQPAHRLTKPTSLA